MDRDKLYSMEVEEQILGISICETKCFIQVMELKVKESDFYFDRNKILFNAIKTVFREKQTTDFVILAEYLKKNNTLDKVGGITKISDLMGGVITTSNIKAYVEALKEYSQKRYLINISKSIQLNIDKSPEEIQQVVNTLIVDMTTESSTETVEGQEEEYLNVLDKRMKGEINPLRTGLRDLDNNITGFSGGDLVTIFAFSGVGKTTLATQIALNVIRQKKRVLFFSLEMPKEQIRDRIISNLTNIPFRNIKYGRLQDEELNKVIMANGYLSRDKGLLVSEEDELVDITSKIQYEVLKNNIDIVFIDYINLVNITGNNKEEHQRITECTRLFKKLAKSIKKPIVILAQGKQESAYKMQNKNIALWDKVAVNDIAGGASIYRDSDIVLGMYRNVELDNKLVRDYLVKENEKNIDYNSPLADKNPECVNILIKKSRASKKDILNFRWKAESYRINNW
ncbi:MAG: DnaB-like helicase C-terminal domain-containing protein [Clostridium saudiense]|uniref:replicative DNA helicase n=1 Tax=Clostridium saudiense TaxID=1414720 RepID=UPI002910CBA1|nr:DnaB-like helicase C-terminal domain-containing protein [Clostridium saudiense]MDU3523390.1 DnaB-like helicase C-terminal domain-containing protein [Clostridium saudiense]